MARQIGGTTRLGRSTVPQTGRVWDATRSPDSLSAREAAAINRVPNPLEPGRLMDLAQNLGLAGARDLIHPPRLLSPIADVAMELAPHLVRMHPGLRAVDYLLLVREVSEQLAGQGTIPRWVPGVMNTSLGIINPGQWTASCQTGSLANGIWEGTSVPGQCGAVYTREAGWQGGPVQGNDARAAAQYIGASGNAQFPELWTTTARWNAQVGAAPSIISGVGLRTMGLGAPMEFSDLRDSLGHLGLPNLAMPRRPLSETKRQINARIRTGLGLRVSGITRPQPRPRARPQRTPWGSAVTIPSTTIIPGSTTRPQRLRPGPRHEWKPPGARARQKKLLITPAYLAAKAVFSVLTESNDAIKALWDALDRRFKTARVTDSGNRRTDAMLADIWRGWDSIAWGEAVQNLQNTLETDMVFGLLGKAMWAAGRVAHGGQSGLGTGSALQGEAWFQPTNIDDGAPRMLGWLSAAQKRVHANRIANWRHMTGSDRRD